MSHAEGGAVRELITESFLHRLFDNVKTLRWIIGKGVKYLKIK